MFAFPCMFREKSRAGVGPLQVVGETEDEERARPASELWGEALQRRQWRVIRHITGDGRRSWGEARSASPARQLGTASPAPASAQLPSATSVEWRSYIGEPLILSKGEFADLCERAGSIYQPLDKITLQRLRPLVNEAFSPLKPRKHVT